MLGCLPAQQDDNSVTLCRNETEHEDILAATRIAFRSCVTERTFGMQHDLFVFCTDEMIDDVRG
jgi:hypothetical protein